MRKVLFLFATLIALVAPTYAQSGITGTWRIEGAEPAFPWEAVLRADGANLSGALTSCSSSRGAIDIYEGKVDGETITFKCKSLNRVRTMIFTGKVEGGNCICVGETRSRWRQPQCRR
jgi:hypothetical protein